MRLGVTGASSFVGAHLCREARGRHSVAGIVHRTPLKMAGVETVSLDLTREDAASRLRSLKLDALIHVAFKVKRPPGGGEISALNGRMMDACLGAGIPLLYGSSTVAGWARSTAYGRDRLADEARIVASGIPHIILRPSAPFGPPLKGHTPAHTESFFTLTRLIQRSPVIPMVGRGLYRRQPLYIPDFARAALELLEEEAFNQRFEIGGGEALSFRDIILTLGRALGRSPRLLPLPAQAFAALARIHPDFDPELIRTLAEDEIADNGPLVRHLGWSPRPFRHALGALLF